MYGERSALEIFRQDLYHCADCNYCVDAVWAERGIEHVCATITHHSPALSYSGRGYIAAARALLEGQALNLEVLAERAFSCTGCGNCESICPIGLRPAQVGQALREMLAAQDHLPAPLAALRTRVREQGNVYGAPAAARSAWATGLEFTAGPLATLQYAPGCATAHARPAEARAAVRLLQLAGERVGYSPADDACCGAPLREAGLPQDAAYAEQTLAGRLRAPLLVTSGLECAPAWQRGVTAERVLSFPQWLLQALLDARLQLIPRATRPSVVHVFDSCASRRPGALRAAIDPTRAILQHLAQTVENPAMTASHGVCCGAAGSLATLHPAAAARMGATRRGAATVPVVAGDVRCLTHLAGSAGEGGEQLFGVAEFLLHYFEVEGRAT